MTPERWQKVEAVLQEALDRPPQDRVSYLDEACEGDAELKLEASSLIRAYDESGDFIEESAIVEDARLLIDALDHNIGRDIGAYTILERLGSGGMGEVYLAHDRRLNRKVALKILPAFFAADDMRLRRFQREAQAASALNHPNILTIHEVGEHVDIRFIATEFIDGQTIRELVQTDLTLGEILDIAEQVASALGTAHAAGIVHRDIKPENIMRRNDGLVKILDFGIVKLMERPSAEDSDVDLRITQTHTEMGVVMGTAGYMSPEQARGLPVDERTDIWSLGVVLYEMLARRAPFTGATRMDTMVAILEREPFRILPSVALVDPFQRIRQIVTKTLSKDRAERYQSALEVVSQLKAARQELSGDWLQQPPEPFKQCSVPPRSGAVESHSAGANSLLRTGESGAGTPASTTLSRPVASRRKVAAMLGVAMLVLAVLGAAFIYRRPANSPPLAATNEIAASSTKVYSLMNDAEQMAFIRAQEQRISAMMGDRPAELNEEALRAIKAHVDHYVAHDGKSPSDETLTTKFARATPYIPLIVRSFAARKVPVIIGIYLPMIESAYRPCFESPLGAKGLYQFLPATAKLYGVSPDEMCDEEKMTPAAAAYIADHMAELGDDAESMTLVLLSFNRGATSVRGTLRELRDKDDYQRNFWTLFAHREKLDKSFRNESARYVPAFLATAIIGENPEAFGMQTPALSSLANSSQQPKTSSPQGSNASR